MPHSVRRNLLSFVTCTVARVILLGCNLTLWADFLNPCNLLTWLSTWLDNTQFKNWDARTRLPGQRTRVRRSDVGGTPQTARPCCVVPRGDSRIGPTRLKSAPTRPKSGRLGPYRPVSAKTAELGRNSKTKKKKGAKRTVWLNLNTQTPSDPHTSSKTPKHPLSLHPSSPFSVCSVLHLSSLCSELSVSGVCTLHCFSLQVCSLCSFLEFLFFVLYDFSLSNCLEMNLWIWKFMWYLLIIFYFVLVSNLWVVF